MKENFTVIIPARLDSSRLPQKLLQSIGEQSVLQRTYLAAQKSQASEVVIAADDKVLIDAAQQFGATARLTSKSHQSGTDRLAECVCLLNLDDDEIIVNVQGDEPFMPPALINLCAKTLAKDSQAVTATLAVGMIERQEINNPNAVKVVLDNDQRALFFSRAAIPFNRDNIDLTDYQCYFHHLGIYAYRAGFLKRYHQLPVCDLERIEKLEQLRILANGEKIAVAIVDEKPPKGIDTLDDLQAARRFVGATKNVS